MPVLAWNKLTSKKFLTDHVLRFMEGVLYEDSPWTYYVVKNLQRLYVIPDITYHYYKRPLSITTGADKAEVAYQFSIIYEDIARHFTPGEEAREAKYYLGPFFSYCLRYHKMEGYKRALPLFEMALGGDECRKERLLLGVLRLSFKSVFLHWMLIALLRIRFVIRNLFRRMAALKKKK